jgi:hypothetical protein
LASQLARRLIPRPTAGRVKDLFLQTFAARYGIKFSRAGNGICHQVHTERFVRLGADPHTPTSGACVDRHRRGGGLEGRARDGRPCRAPGRLSG